MEGREIYGAEKACLRLFRSLEDSALEVGLCTLEYGAEASGLARAATEVLGAERVTTVPGRGNVVSALRGVLRKSPESILCTVGYKCDVLTRLAGIGFARRYVAFVHGWSSTERKLRLYQAVDKLFVAAGFDALIAVSPDLPGAVPRLGRTVPHRIVPNGVDVEQVRKLSRDPVDPAWVDAKLPMVGYFGRLDSEKGPDLLARAMASLPEVRFVFAGDGPLGPLVESLARAAGAEDRLTLTGYLPNPYPLMARCSVVVIPSLAEAMPLVLLEAMSLGLPVVATAVGAVPLVLEQGKNGTLVEKGDVASLAGAIRRLLDSPSLRERLGNSALKAVESRYSLEHCAREFERAILDWSETWRRDR